MAYCRLYHVEQEIARHLAPFVNEDGTYNTPSSGPIELHDMDLDLEAFLRILELCKVWRTRKPRSRRPEMSFLYTMECSKPLDENDNERLKRTMGFVLALVDHPAIAGNIVSKVCWLYVIYKYLDVTPILILRPLLQDRRQADRGCAQRYESMAFQDPRPPQEQHAGAHEPR